MIPVEALAELAIRVGGVLLAAFGVFHVFFDRIFAWKSDFARLSPVNAKVLYTIHLFLIPFFFFMAWISFRFGDELARAHGLAGAVTGFCSLFWLARCVWQIIYFKPSKNKVRGTMSAAHYLIIASSFVLALCYGLPIFMANS